MQTKPWHIEPPETEPVSGRGRDPAASARVRAVLQRLAPGDGTAFALPAEGPTRRIANQRIANVAHALWGRGSYRIRGTETHATITRLKERA